MDEIIQFIILINFVFSSIFFIKKKQYAHPYIIVNVVFFLPLFFSLFRLSDLQENSWDLKTYIIIIYTLIGWNGLFFISAFLSSKKKNIKFISNISSTHKIIFITFTLVVLFLFLLSNYIQTGMILVYKNPTLADEIHAEFPQGIRLFARMILLSVILLYILYYKYRTKYILLLLLIMIFLPLTRLSRFDLFMSVAAIVILHYYYPIFKFNKKKVLLCLLLFSFLTVLITTLTESRMNQGGRYQLKYAKIIQWNSDLSFPVFPILYGYFSLSFENFDRYVRLNDNKIYYNLGILEFLYVGIFKLNLFMDDFKPINYSKMYQPVSTAATVPTILIIFYRDFGLLLSFFFILGFGIFWLILYRLSFLSLSWNLTYVIFSSAFSLASFQPTVFAPMIFQQILMIFLLVSIANKYYRKKVIIS